MPKAVKIICIALLIIGLLSFAYPVLAQGRGGPQSNYCKENIGNCEYPGECHDYRDSNNDGHCDRIVYSSGTASNTPAAQTTTTTNNGASSPASTTTASGSSTTGTAGTPGNAQSNGSRYNFLVLLATVVAAYGATWLLSARNVISTLLHRKIWNVILLVSAVAMLILSLLLTLREEFHLNIQLPFDLTFWHV